MNVYFFFCQSSPEQQPQQPHSTTMESSLTTSSEHALPSPTKVRMRKNRHRRNSSRGSNVLGNSSPAKSPSREPTHGSEAQPTDLGPVTHSAGETASMQFLGPGMAVRDNETLPERLGSHLEHHVYHVTGKNLNDVCFGCDGGCSDTTCSSKRSSRASADVESNACDSPCRSPLRSFKDTLGMIENTTNENQSKDLTCEKDSNENLSCPVSGYELRTVLETAETEDQSNPQPTTSQFFYNKPLKRTISDPLEPANRKKGPSVKRLDSVESGAESITEPVHRRRTKVSSTQGS